MSRLLAVVNDNQEQVSQEENTTHSRIEELMPLKTTSHRPEIPRSPFLATTWKLHFAAILCVMCIGISLNGGQKKYIPIQPYKAGNACEKAFLNVMAIDSTEEDAIVCCYGSSQICQTTRSKGLPFADNLSKFPDAWLLPLFPILLRFLYKVWRSLSTKGILPVQSLSSVLSLRRLIFYILLMNIRGWILYVLFNEVEDRLVRPEPGTCWYLDYLHDHQPDCYGRVFDFSDHAVLYFAQILPIALVEVLYAFEKPYWEEHVWVARLLWMGMLYLYVIVFAGFFRTAQFFHTGKEVVVGLGVSLCLQIPIMLLQCRQGGQWRSFLFGPPSFIPAR